MSSEIQGLRTVEIKKVTQGFVGGRKQCKSCWLQRHLHRCFPRSYFTFYPSEKLGTIRRRNSQSLLSFLIIVPYLKSHCWHLLYRQKRHQRSPTSHWWVGPCLQHIVPISRYRFPWQPCTREKRKAATIPWAFAACWTLLQTLCAPVTLSSNERPVACTLWVKF